MQPEDISHVPFMSLQPHVDTGPPDIVTDSPPAFASWNFSLPTWYEERYISWLEKEASSLSNNVR